MRLIDADALGIRDATKEAYDAFIKEGKEWGYDKEASYDYDHYSWQRGYTDGLLHADGEIKFAPTIDAVQVVRCRDCKHYNAGFECLIEGYGIERPADYFCADGERKDGGQGDA